MTRLLKDSGAVPEGVAFRQDLARLRALLVETADRDKRRALIAEIAVLETKIDLSHRRG